LVWRGLGFYDQFGARNDILLRLGLIQINWLGDPVLAMMMAVILLMFENHAIYQYPVSGWAVDSPDLYEAHSIDSNTLAKLPPNYPAAADATNFDCTTVSVCSGFRFFDLIAVMTGEVLCD